jgi:carbon monoxide dehydrogenase subunit G
LKFNGTYELNSTKEQVWKNLNDTNILKECIDGCKEFANIENNKYKALILVKLGPVNASFQSIIEIKNIIEEESYDLIATGNARQLGHASGNINVALKENKNKTILSYSAETRINGKLAQLGSRLIDGSVKKNTDLFFKNFSKILDNNIVEIEKTRNVKKVSSIKLFFFTAIIVLLILIYLSFYAK